MEEPCKACFKCGAILPLSAFYAHPQMADGHLGKCKECTKVDVRENYRATIVTRREYERKRSARPARKATAAKAQRTRRARHPEKDAARRILNYAVRTGKIIRPPCERCGSDKRVEGHHDDYTRPLDVHWLCFCCHRSEHGQTPATNQPKDT